jgi:hypothetical protein
MYLTGASEHDESITSAKAEMPVSSMPTSFQYVTDAQEEDEDVHTCAKCKLAFTSLEAYFDHKMSSKTCGKQFDQNRKNILKRLGPRRGRPPGRKRQCHDTPYNPTAVKKELVNQG